MKKPNLEVIDQAILRIKDEWRVFTCLALRDAAASVLGVSRHGRVADRYVSQYGKWNKSCNQGKFPKWWNKTYSNTNRLARIKALKGFRQACIDAGKIK